MKYDEFVKGIEEIKQNPGVPLSKENGLWKVTKREILWEQLGSRIFDRHLEMFKEIAITVLSERDPAFELPKDERYAANIQGKTLAHSPSLRKGIAESLALLGNRAEALVNCSPEKAHSIVILTIREIFKDADWVLWGSLNSLLPILAEAAPREFLAAIIRSLRLKPNPFVELFSQEGGGFTGTNYLTGLLWALETLAWVPEYLVDTCIILGKLASHDKGGQWANRPDNSLTAIFLPWLPQTLADIDKRAVAVKTLCVELPDIGWKLLIDLLPGRHGSSMYNPKPKWIIQVPEDIKVTNKEYWEQNARYAELTVKMAEENIARLTELISHLDQLNKPSIDQLLVLLSAPNITELSEEERTPLWESLTHFIHHHKRFADAEWAWKEEQLLPVELAANRLAPISPIDRYKLLFSNNTFDLYEENDNWQEQEAKLYEKRRVAVIEVLKWGGTEAIARFISVVESPYQVGWSLGIISNDQIDQSFVSEWYMEDQKTRLPFIQGYVENRLKIKKWTWVDKLDRTKWTLSQTVTFLTCLPFVKDTWDRVSLWLDIYEIEYWQKVVFNPFRADDQLIYAVEKLLKYNRPRAAIDCIYTMHHLKQQIPVEESILALISAATSKEPPRDIYHTIELIKALRGMQDIDEKKLIQVEWIYLQFFDSYGTDWPETLEYRLACDSDFFCEILRMLYRSRKKTAQTKEPNEQSKFMAQNAWHLFHNWHIPPGKQKDGSFIEEQFEKWITRVKEICEETGHIEIALQTVGQVLIHAPADASGLWVNKSVAKMLNAEDHEQMRKGYSVGTTNSRGVHWIDPTGAPEKELAAQYRQKAEEVENAGYHRFASLLRSIAKSYDAEAEVNIREHLQEIKEDEE